MTVHILGPTSGGVSGGGLLDSDGIQGATFADETTERVFHTITIPANTVGIGDMVNLGGYIEMLSPGAGGGVRTRIRRDDRVGPIVADTNFRTPLGLPAQIGFEFFHGLIVDTGAGLSAARMINSNDGVDFVFDFTANIVLVLTAEWSVAALGNEYRGLVFHASKS